MTLASLPSAHTRPPSVKLHGVCSELRDTSEKGEHFHGNTVIVPPGWVQDTVDMSGLSPLLGRKATSPDVSRLSLLQALVLFYCRRGQNRESDSLLLIGRNLWVDEEELQTACTSSCPASWSSWSFISHVLWPLGSRGQVRRAASVILPPPYQPEPKLCF